MNTSSNGSLILEAINKTGWEGKYSFENYYGFGYFKLQKEKKSLNFRLGRYILTLDGETKKVIQNIDKILSKLEIKSEEMKKNQNSETEILTILSDKLNNYL